MALKKETKSKVVAKAAAKPTKSAKTVKETVSKAKKAAPKGKTSEVEFKVFSPASDSVAIAGDFNAWKPIALKKSKSGAWSGKIKLSVGEYQYKIVFDGKYWEIDNSNPERVSDGQGGENSRLRVN
jgi:1,4-alpha-glucan branching enzyme